MNWAAEISSMLDVENGEHLEYSNPDINSEEMTREFNEGYGIENGCPFIAFSNTHVYFPVCYDGSEWVGCVPRNFPSEPQGHVGG